MKVPSRVRSLGGVWSLWEAMPTSTELGSVSPSTYVTGDGPVAKTSKSKTCEMPRLVTWAQKDGLPGPGPCHSRGRGD